MRTPVACLASLLLLGACATAPQDVMDPASTPVSYILQFTLREGQEQAFRVVMADMVAATRQESGTLVYEWYLAADGRTGHIREHFADTAAYREHGDSFATKFADRFLPCLDITGVSVYGNPDAEARAMMAAMAPTYFTVIGGFRR